MPASFPGSVMCCFFANIMKYNFTLFWTPMELHRLPSEGLVDNLMMHIQKKADLRVRKKSSPHFLMSECSASESRHYCSGFSFQNTWAFCNHFSLQFSPCVSWRHLWMQLNAASPPNCHGWSAGGKIDAVSCWLVHRGHAGCLFLTDFSLFPWLHFYQQLSAGKHN